MGLGSALCVIVLAGNIYTSLDAGIGVVKRGRKGGGGFEMVLKRGFQRA
jgi:hypothetical protein